MDQNRAFPFPLANTVAGMIASVEYVDDGTTTTATATLDNGLKVVGKHTFARAKHFTVQVGRAGALDDVKLQVHKLLEFRHLDALAVERFEAQAGAEPHVELVELREEVAAAVEAAAGLAVEAYAPATETPAADAATEESAHEQP